MARLVAVVKYSDEDYPFEKRQMPLYIDDSLTMVLEFSDNMLNLDKQQIDTVQLEQFIQRHRMLKEQDLASAMTVTSREVFNALSQLLPCVGCRRCVERLFSQVMQTGIQALDPLSVGANGVLTLSHGFMTDATKLYTLFYMCGSKMNNELDAIAKNKKGKKNNRCKFHSLDVRKPKPVGGHWMDVWEVMSPECRDEVALIDSNCLLETLENYLQKHRFCADCKNKVHRAFNILTGELDFSKVKGYCANVYQGLRCCPHEGHIHLCCETDFIAHVLGRAEPEFAGGRRERHAKTIDVAQEEVLTCLGIHLYERLHRIWLKLRAEVQTRQMLFYLGVDALRKSFEVTVEKVRGISRMDQYFKDILEEEKVQELKQEKKRQKKNRKKNKSSCDLPTPLETKSANPSQKNEPPGFMESDGNPCNISEDSNMCAEVTVKNEDLLRSHKVKKGLTPHSNVSDCGYSSSLEGSEPGSQEGSDVACAEGICKHDEAGDDKEEEEGDSCVECWNNCTKDNIKGKNKKKKKKCKPFKCENENTLKQVPYNTESSDSVHSNPNEETKVYNFCMDSEFPRRPWIYHRNEFFSDMSSTESQTRFYSGRETKSLKELLDESECSSQEEDEITQDDIQAFKETYQTFYRDRQQFRQCLKENFKQFCLHQNPSLLVGNTGAIN
ncbi:hypothetical protein XENTR_v10005653 [Xenopus tropicalis]|uniref:Gametogenetin-binding protein 2 n=1 Tax=Xenopus tropicalis TaxID=8364 RepID=A0A8J0SGW9_XENTR|nr:gametogenetin-binding protein 2 isoform X2 [Xenopus tropicalis]KAE8623560.1 hypothetical protein XENTR_v10005653 [Xenopus tropicalis]|eukprot:XP_012815401.1 PREDICTED: gametogenetin-binding protein 2 isoform X2 [Xenopus tropicalis]